MFGRNNSKASTDTENSVEDSLTPAVRGQGKKGRPTPKRADVEAQHYQPIVPADRKAAKAKAREEKRAERERRAQAMARGDESVLPERDRGPVAKYVRDIVDSRWNVAEFMLPVAFVVIFFSYINNRVIQQIVFVALWAIMIGSVFDLFLVSRIVKRRVIDKFGEQALVRKPVSYGVLRAMQLRRLRVPKPAVKRGEVK